MFVLPEKGDILFNVDDREKILEAIIDGFIVSETAPSITFDSKRDIVVYIVENNYVGSCAKFLLETIEYSDKGNKWIFKKNEDDLLYVSYIGDINQIPASVFKRISSTSIGQKGYGFFR